MFHPYRKERLKRREREEGEKENTPTEARTTQVRLEET